MSDSTKLSEALETWESYLAGIHTCDMGEPEAVANLHVVDAARKWLALLPDEDGNHDIQLRHKIAAVLNKRWAITESLHETAEAVLDAITGDTE